MRLRKKRKEVERPPVGVKENFYGHSRHTGKDINNLMQEYARVFPSRAIKSNYGYTYGIKHPSGFNLTACYGHEVIYIVGTYRGIGGTKVVLTDYQLDALVDKLYTIMVEEVASETLRISQIIEEVK